MGMTGDLVFFIVFSVMVAYGILDRIHYVAVRKPIKKQIKHTTEQISAVNRIVGRYTANQANDPDYEEHLEEFHAIIDLLTAQLKFREYRKYIHRDPFSSLSAWIHDAEHDEHLQRMADFNVDLRMGKIDITKSPYTRKD